MFGDELAKRIADETADFEEQSLELKAMVARAMKKNACLRAELQKVCAARTALEEEAAAMERRNSKWEAVQGDAVSFLALLHGKVAKARALHSEHAKQSMTVKFAAHRGRRGLLPPEIPTVNMTLELQGRPSVGALDLLRIPFRMNVSQPLQATAEMRRDAAIETLRRVLAVVAPDLWDGIERLQTSDSCAFLSDHIVLDAGPSPTPLDIVGALMVPPELLGEVTMFEDVLHSTHTTITMTAPRKMSDAFDFFQLRVKSSVDKATFLGYSKAVKRFSASTSGSMILGCRIYDSVDVVLDEEQFWTYVNKNATAKEIISSVGRLVEPLLATGTTEEESVLSDVREFHASLGRISISAKWS